MCCKTLKLLSKHLLSSLRKKHRVFQVSWEILWLPFFSSIFSFLWCDSAVTPHSHVNSASLGCISSSLPLSSRKQKLSPTPSTSGCLETLTLSFFKGGSRCLSSYLSFLPSATNHLLPTTAHQQYPPLEQGHLGLKCQRLRRRLEDSYINTCSLCNTHFFH